ncbi:hypothetical protein KQX54_011143 [Cotesia glomerata]|uniref:Uncharacterized protein n=1 Tax=Cotesia glomerata TaxID=32391 RepID=A0AAV7J6K3_COTGL|nr:hypothetical protein KQX54_011143 [Cotesia glomerata]
MNSEIGDTIRDSSVAKPSRSLTVIKNTLDDHWRKYMMALSRAGLPRGLVRGDIYERDRQMAEASKEKFQYVIRSLRS